MSAGKFQNSRYESNTGQIYKARIQPETLTATIGGLINTPPAAAVNTAVSASMRGGKRRFGVNARSVTFKFTGALPDGYSGDNVTIPVLQPSTYTSWTFPADQTGTYLGVGVQVVGSSNESVK